MPRQHNTTVVSIEKDVIGIQSVGKQKQEKSYIK